MSIVSKKHTAIVNKILVCDVLIKHDSWSRYSKQQLKCIGESFSRALLSDQVEDKLFTLSRTIFFSIFIPELSDLEKVPQHKQKSKNALHHSLVVATKVTDNPILRWAALLHDIGKGQYKTDVQGKVSFRNHEHIGSVNAKGLLKRLSIPNKGDICKLIRYHSHPLDYQRQPNWKMSTVKRFCEKHEHLSVMLIDLAIADKIASSSQSDYLEDLYELRKMVEDIQYA